MLIYDLSLKELSEILQTWGEPGFRSIQVWEGVYKSLWNNPDLFTQLPLQLRKKIGDTFTFEGVKQAVSLQSRDKLTTKSLFLLEDGEKIETVLMQYEKRNTLCISSQVGCAMGCAFCATGQMGFHRNLTSGEIIAQVMHFARILQARKETVSNIVVMGMGEPFHNYKNTMEAIDRLNDTKGYGLGARRFTISTVGIIPAIRKFADEKRQINLAISLHAIDDVLRSSILPINKKYPVDDLLSACREYVSITGRRITFEWALIQGVNDSVSQAKTLAKKVKGMLCHVNIIQLNETKGYQGKGSSHKSAKEFKETLESFGIPCSIRQRKGIEIQAGCGQLASSH